MFRNRRKMSKLRPKRDEKEMFENLSKDLHELVANKHNLKTSVEHFFNNLVDEITLGIIFDLHRKFKTNAYDLDPDDDEDEEEEENGELDIFAQHNHKTPDCVCPKCEKTVGPGRFVVHLETCMGMGRSSKTRNSTRRVPISIEDDDDDVHWNCKNRRRKKKNKNGTKKTKSTPKKPELDNSDSVNIDVEIVVDDGLTNLKDILLLQDDLVSSSNSSGSSSKKRDKSRSRKSSKRDRTSPSSSISID